MSLLTSLTRTSLRSFPSMPLSARTLTTTTSAIRPIAAIALKPTAITFGSASASALGSRRWISESSIRSDGGQTEAPHDGSVRENQPATMDRQPPPAPGEDFNVLMIGAGNIMFGSDEGPWNHSFRIEHKLGPRLKVVGLVDPAAARAEAVLAGKRASFVESAYRDTVVYKTIEDFHKSMTPDKEPKAIIVGSPPAYRGGTAPKRNTELKLIDLFPNSAFFIEKPVSTGPVEEALSVTQSLVESGQIVSVGYMLRYLRCVQKMKQIIAENNLTVMATVARYACAYNLINKPAWWNKSIDQGPVIEQGTHFADLSRYFGGDVLMDTVQAHSVEWDEAPGQISSIPVDESIIPEQERIPRLTSATWKYAGGAVGTLIHSVNLIEGAYSCSLEIFCDGFLMRLIDPYGSPVLYVRRPGDDIEERHAFVDDDPFFSEVSNFVDAIEDGPTPFILSSFEDATKTYDLTWAIRKASEESAQKIRDAKARSATLE